MKLLYDRHTGAFSTGPFAPDKIVVQPGQIPAYTRLPSAHGFATVLPDIDLEGYSEAGYKWDPEKGLFTGLEESTKKGIFAVGGAVYAEHPSTEVLSLAYDLKDGLGPRLWVPGMPPPTELLNHITKGGLLEAWNCLFEFRVWNNALAKRFGWPELKINQLRDAMEKARAHALPGALDNCGKVLECDTQKQKEGKSLINRFCIPCKPTKAHPYHRHDPKNDPKGPKLYSYNIDDIRAEADISAHVPDLSEGEEKFALATRLMNLRGVGVDTESVNACLVILRQAYAKYNAQIAELTGGAVSAATERDKMVTWLGAQGVFTNSLATDAVEEMLTRELPPLARLVLQLRQKIAGAGVRKLFAMQRQTTQANRLCDLFIFHGARTGRDTGADVQPQNLVKDGAALSWCADCGKPSGQHHKIKCPHCGCSENFSEKTGWMWQATDAVLAAIKTKSLETVEYFFGDAVAAISGCMRGLFVAKEGHELIASDYSSIEAVVAAALAGEEWRLDAFRQGHDIYLRSCAKITGHSFEWYLANGGKKHPDRQNVGKPAELGLTFGGWLNAWRIFDSSDMWTDEEVKQKIKSWRAASPAIIEMWGGQVRGKPWAPERYELFGLEGCAIAAIQNPGTCYAYNGITYGVNKDVLLCMLPSGRKLSYHKPRLVPSDRYPDQVQINFMGWNTDPAKGARGWVQLSTFGGRLFENVVQAVARDIMAHAVPLLEAAGYPIVLRVHDELVAEVLAGAGSIEQFEYLMAHPKTLPSWAREWPIKAAGGYRAYRYRKD